MGSSFSRINIDSIYKKTQITRKVMKAMQNGGEEEFEVEMIEVKL